MLLNKLQFETRLNQYTRSSSIQSINKSSFMCCVTSNCIAIKFSQRLIDYVTFKAFYSPYRNVSWCPWWHYSMYPNLHRSWWLYKLFSMFFWTFFDFFFVLTKSRRKCGKIEKRLIHKRLSCILFFVRFSQAYKLTDNLYSIIEFCFSRKMKSFLWKPSLVVIFFSLPIRNWKTPNQFNHKVFTSMHLFPTSHSS